MTTVRPRALVVQQARSVHPVQRSPNFAARFTGVKATVCPAGQLTVPAASSTAKSAAVNPPAMSDRVGHGLITAVCPAAARAASIAPVP
jgi:hypothetical protein